ncbi:probable mannitol dehydrogenase isoform X2 [Phalaenopsis equestris]|uniref:probable mannitol dehydrogenase isoform X2 n=1 Tax=Phalaenopsis equestris TaxID=78828 RepID=UPI0009E509B4|nr:probable mannitol dehydrogenase isoform X2 [Phalaenopsis equestris]
MEATENVMKASTERRHRKAFGFAAKDTTGFLSPFTFSRRENGDCDVTIKILYCGICHTDLHSIKNDWKDTVYPLVPGHEIAGIITEAGCNVQKLKIGDKVGVGCLVGACRSCDRCIQHKENYCPKLVFSYNSVDIDGKITYGGYSNIIVVDEHFVVKFPENFPMDRGAPLLCAGITVYSPMKNFELNQPGKNIGVVGLGGLGHVAVKFGKAFGAKVTVISSSPWKKEEAIKQLGADTFLVSTDAEQIKAAKGTMDGIINTVSAKHALLPLILLLKSEGKMIMVGAPEHPLDLPALPLLLVNECRREDFGWQLYWWNEGYTGDVRFCRGTQHSCRY